MSNTPTRVRYDLSGSWLYAKQLVGSAPEATSFAFYIINEQTQRFTATTPPVRGGDNEIGKRYRIPGPMPVPLSAAEVLGMLNGCILESSITIRPGEGAEASATLQLFQDFGGGERRFLGEATAEFETIAGGVQECRPRILLEGV
jgi:hypothetical protein